MDNTGATAHPGPVGESEVRIRPALPRDVPTIRSLVEPYAERRILLAKDLVGYYEGVQEFLVAQVGTDVVGCGALHVMWEDLAEVRTLAVHEGSRGTGIGHLMLEALLARARDLGLTRVFCLTFEVDFFTRHGFAPIVGDVVDERVFHELLLSRDDGIAEFLDLARVKPNTLGNTRMLKVLDRPDGAAAAS
ncbi:amino-acid N-acetyltransferase [Occultella glacieicola]|uniref:Amino-acid N-acetyltransferase n=1 Tax=Occultella glacieicola TaxID=2518684 RepID=A0ABY2E1F3_9MICO|nr:amino-acid N-acetyltransferase [Occultella glacieicola]TDE91757.1 amino-acid N-acetyltransferase [Occultella glacieicola]